MPSINRRPDGQWRARYRSPEGREHARHFNRKIDAERWLANVTVARARGEWIDPDLGRRTFESWCDEWMTTLVDLRPSTVDRDTGLVRNYLIPAFGRTQLAKMTSGQIRTWLAETTAAADVSPATVRKAGQVLAKILSAAAQDGLIPRSPATGVRLPVEVRREMRFLTALQVEQLADATGDHYRPMIHTAAYGGLRWGELAGLRPQHVDLERRTIAVVEQLTEVNGTLAWGPPKTAAGRRSLNIPKFLVAELAEHLGRATVAATGLVFPSPEGTPLRRSNFRRRTWTTATAAVGLTGVRFHDLRHTAVALAIQQGAHPKAIQERMGHSSVMVTMDRYGHLFPALDQGIADGLDAARAAIFAD